MKNKLVLAYLGELAKKKNNKLVLGYIMVILSAVIFGLMPLATGMIRNSGANSMTIVFLRNLLSLPVLAALAILQNKTLKVPVKSLPAMSVAAAMGCCLTPMLLYSAYSYLAENDSVATVFHFIYPAVVVLGGWLFFKQKINKGTLFSLVLCIAGICLFYDPGKPLNTTGAILALLSGVTYAAYVLALSTFRFKQIKSFLFSFYVSAISSVILLAVCLATHQLSFPGTALGWIVMILFALAINVGAVVLFQVGVFIIGGQKASILSTMEPITSIVVSAVSGVAIGVMSVIGAALVVASTVLISVFGGDKK